MDKQANIVNLFLNSAKKHGERLAFIHGKENITYNDLQKDLLSKAYLYKKKGIKKSSRVLLLTPLSIDLYSSILALFYIGATPVFLDEWVSIARLKECCKVVPCDGIIAPKKTLWYSYLISALRNIDIKIKSNATTNSIYNIPPENITIDDTALITFTTGTTGIPKAADRTHNFLQAQYTALLPLVDNSSKISLVTLPIVVLINLALGKTTILPSGKLSEQDTINNIVSDLTKYRTEEIITSPAPLNDICNTLQTSSTDITNVISGGGAIFPDLAKLITSTFPKAKCIAVYGSTEVEPISKLNMNYLKDISIEQILKNGLPVGNIDPAAKVAIMPIRENEPHTLTQSEFNTRSLTYNTPGEVVVTGSHVLKAYINNTNAAKQFKINVSGIVWHKTGDIGSWSKDGTLNLWGNKKDYFHYNGSVYYPMILCYAFKESTGKDAALLMYKNRPTIVIEHTSPLSAEPLRSTLKELRLENVNIRYIANLPRDPRHRTKVDYDKLFIMLSRK